MGFKEISQMWKEDKKQYVKKSTIVTYQLLIQNHINPYFGDMLDAKEEDVQKFVLEKLENVLSEELPSSFRFHLTIDTFNID